MRDYRIDLLRSFCNVLLLVVHSYPFMYVHERCVEFWVCTFISRHLTIVLLPTLFFLSGYCLFLSDGSAWSKIKSRFRRLLAPYFLWNILFLMVYFLLCSFSSKMYQNLVEWDCLSFGGCLKRIFSVNDSLIDGPMWFVRCIFILCLCYPLLKLLYKHITYLQLIILGVLFVLFGNDGYYPAYAIVSFIFGGYVSFYKIDIFDFVKRNYRVFWMIAIVGLILGFLLNFRHDSIAEPIGICKLMTLPLFYLLFDNIAMVMKSRFFKSYIMPASYTIFASHIFFTSVYIHLLGILIPEKVGSMVCISVLSILLSLLSSVVLWHIANKAFPKIFRIFDGRW